MITGYIVSVYKNGLNFGIGLEILNPKNVLINYLKDISIILIFVPGITLIVISNKITKRIRGIN